MEKELMFIAFDEKTSEHIKEGSALEHLFLFDWTVHHALFRCQEREANANLVFYEARVYMVLEISMEREQLLNLIKNRTICVEAGLDDVHFYEWFGALHLDRFDTKWITVQLPPLEDDAWAHTALEGRFTPVDECMCWECKQGPLTCWIYPNPARRYCASCWKKSFTNGNVK
jgi:hypothetical protein